VSRLGNRTVRLCALMLLLALLMAPTAAWAKDFSIDSIGIGAAVDANGDLRVTEDRVIDFNGQFSWAEWKLNTKGSEGIEILGVSSVNADTEQPYTKVDGEATTPGTYSVTDNGDSVVLRLAFSAQDQKMRFRINYVAHGAAKRYTDTSELYWQFIGDETELSAGRVSVDIAPPTPLTKEQVRAWAHGPLTGVVAIGSDGRVTLEVPELPANTFVEARVLYPPDALASAPIIDQPREQVVLAEEAKWAKEANAERTRARFGIVLAIGFSALLSLGALGFGIWAFLRHGKEYKPEFPGGYLREDPRPDLSPGVIGSLWRFGTPGNADMAATLMDLADKGIIAMRPTTVHHDGVLGIGAKDETSFELGLNPTTPKQTVGPTDQLLLNLLFRDIGAGGLVTLEEIKSYAKDHPQLYTDKIKEWSDECEAIADSLGLFEGSSWSWRVGMFVLAGVVGVVGFVSAVWGQTVWPVCFAVPSTIALAVMGAYMLRRSRQGNELFAQYKAVHDYLHDFGRLHEVPPQSIVIWNRFLVLAVVFGIATEVINQLRVKMPAVVGDPGFQTTYWWVYSSSGGSSPISSLQGGFASASQIASSALSSSSGGGGGFSGGGGGGGGGGGFSAG
jgi:uncharacterized membrane protein